MFRYSEVAKLSKSWDHGGELSLLEKVFLGVKVCQKVVGFGGSLVITVEEVDSGELARLVG